jgi:hypothetical protein
VRRRDGGGEVKGGGRKEGRKKGRKEEKQASGREKEK